ncbi:MAG: hypothetical protein NWR72_10690 [Bacteroidia bacterium]|nr:hypothetical protein [Bacteroidia bacterium]
MKLEKIVLLIGGLACVGAFFLPFITVASQPISGYTEVMTTLDYFDVVEYKNSEWAIDLFKNGFGNFADLKGYGLLAMLVVVLLGPLIFGLYGLSYIIKALAKRQYKRGVFVNLLFMGFAWLTFYLIQEQNTVNVLGMEIGATLNFFKMAGIGYWLAFGGMMAAAFSLFFGKTE